MKYFLRIVLFVYLLACSLSTFAWQHEHPRASTPAAPPTSSTPFQSGLPVFSNDKITVSGLFPNPASAVAALEYEITGDLKEVKFTMSNVLGNAVVEYKLSKESHRLQFPVSELAPGIYFYTLSAEGKSLFTRKFIIRHSS